MPNLVVRDVRHHYQRIGRAGAAQRVVFVHGLVMDNLSSWYLTVATSVAAFADVLLYDMRGHGLSERPATGYSVEELVQDLLELVDATLGPAPVCIVSNSFGGVIAIEFARRHRERVDSLVLIDGHLGAADFQDKMVGTLSLRGDEAERVAVDLLKNWHGRDSVRKRTSMATSARALIEGTSLVGDLRTKAPLSADDFAAIDAPTVALYGERSDALDASTPLLARMPHCKLEILPGCAHTLLWEATETVRSRVVDFCRGRWGEPS